MRRLSHLRLVALGAVTLVALASCGGESPSMLDPRGSEAREVSGVWWLMFTLAAAVYVVVAAFIVIAIVRGRRGKGERPRKETKDDTFIWLGGIVAPVIILAVLAVVTVNTTQALRNPEHDELRIEVVGERWWWEVRYPDAGFTTANEIHLPVGRPIDFLLLSDNVIHSFWVPQLGGKVDTVPGQPNHLRLKATEPGTYRGECAEYCGIQHAKMHFIVVAEPPADFERWVARRTSGAGLTPDSEQAAQGARVFMRESCAGCHTIRGTQATGELGPDLTDFGSRRWIAAVSVKNTPTNLEAWISNPQTIKPGALMPPSSLSPQELGAVVAYLEGLQ